LYIIALASPAADNTTWLRRLETKVEAREQAKMKELATPEVVTIPIAFNAWQRRGMRGSLLRWCSHRM
jgi:hypothetical protein